MIYFQTFVLLVLAHFVADYPLQTDFIAKFKCRKASLEAVPWYYVMTGHAATHALGVFLVTNNIWLGLVELVFHWLIDWAKCEKISTIHQDQAYHIICKMFYVLVLFTLNFYLPST